METNLQVNCEKEIENVRRILDRSQNKSFILRSLNRNDDERAVECYWRYSMNVHGTIVPGTKFVDLGRQDLYEADFIIIE